jgi:hypothetical protein
MFSHFKTLQSEWELAAAIKKSLQKKRSNEGWPVKFLSA